MTPIIERLAREAGFGHLIGIPGNDRMMEAFAKAIARECAEIADEHASCEGIAQKVAQAIRERFGL